MRLRGRRRVLAVAAPRVQEAGPVLPTDFTAERIAVVAHWRLESTVSLSTNRLVAALVADGYTVLLCSAAEVSQPLIWPEGLPDRTSVFRRANVGYDFGTWAAILDLYPGVLDARIALLVNDSLIGPFAPLDEILLDMASSPVDIWGLVSTVQDGPHLQSHWVAYKNGALKRRGMREFWREIRIEPTKRDLILRYEIGMSEVAERDKLTMGSGFRHDLVVPDGMNPSTVGWRRMLIWGFPFVKREVIVAAPVEIVDSADVPGVIQDMFGEDVYEWI